MTAQAPDLPPIDPNDWSTVAPHYARLESTPLDAAELGTWLRRWSDLQCMIWEARAVLKRERSRDATDERTNAAFQRFAQEIMSPFEFANNGLATKLLAVPADVLPPEYGYIVRLLRQEAGAFDAENAPIAVRVGEAIGVYDACVAAMTTVVDGVELSGPEQDRRLEGDDRDVRERTWRAQMEPWNTQRADLDSMFLDLLGLRRELARNAGLPDVRSYQWRFLGILDYTPDDSMRLHEAIEREIVPLAAQCWEQRRAALRIPTLRPWDLRASTETARPEPFDDLDAFADGMQAIFDHADSALGALFARMRPAHLDLGWRKGKWPGGEEWAFYQGGTPYVMVGQDGSEIGVRLLLHEMGHAFHDALVMERRALFWDFHYPDEMAEFAAIGMSYLALPSLVHAPGDVFDADDTERITRHSLHDAVMQWLPQIAIVDAFAHWVFADAPADVSPHDLDRRWRELGKRFMPWINWTGLQQEASVGWRGEWSLWRTPFYGLAYGIAHLGALDLWRAARHDAHATWQRYREALALGGSEPLGTLFRTAGVRLPFDPAVVRDIASFAVRQLGVDGSEVKV